MRFYENFILLLTELPDVVQRQIIYSYCIYENGKKCCRYSRLINYSSKYYFLGSSTRCLVLLVLGRREGERGGGWGGGRVICDLRLGPWNAKMVVCGYTDFSQREKLLKHMGTWLNLITIWYYWHVCGSSGRSYLVVMGWEPYVNWRINRASRPGGHYYNYYPVALSFKSSHWSSFEDLAPIAFTGARSLFNSWRPSDAYMRR